MIKALAWWFTPGRGLFRVCVSTVVARWVLGSRWTALVPVGHGRVFRDAGWWRPVRGVVGLPGRGCRWFLDQLGGRFPEGSVPGSGDLGGRRYAGSATSVVNSSADSVNSDHGKRLTNPVLRVREFLRDTAAPPRRRDGVASPGWGIIDGWPVVVSCRLGGGGSCRSWHCTDGPPRATSRWWQGCRG